MATQIANGQLIEDLPTAILRLLEQYDTVQVRQRVLTNTLKNGR